MNKNTKGIIDNENFQYLITTRECFTPTDPEQEMLYESINWAIHTLVRQARVIDRNERPKKKMGKVIPFLRIVK